MDFFERLTGMMERIGAHLTYLSEYSKPAFQESQKLQEVHFIAWSDCHKYWGPITNDSFTMC